MILFIFVPWLIFSPFLWGANTGLVNLFFIIPIVTIIIFIVYQLCTIINKCAKLYTVDSAGVGR